MKKILVLVTASLCFSAPTMADISDDLLEAHLVRGTMVCDSKNSIEKFLEIKDRGVVAQIKGCRKIQKRREINIDKPYPLKGYTRVGFADSVKVYVDRDAVIR